MFYNLEILKEYNTKNNKQINSDEFDVDAFVNIIGIGLNQIRVMLSKVNIDKNILTRPNSILMNMSQYWFFSKEVWELLKKEVIIHRNKYNSEQINENDLIENILENLYHHNLKCLKSSKIDKMSLYQNFFLYLRIGMFGLELISRQNSSNFNEILKVLNSNKIEDMTNEIIYYCEENYLKNNSREMLDVIYSYSTWIKQVYSDFVSTNSSSGLKLKTTKLDDNFNLKTNTLSLNSVDEPIQNKKEQKIKKMELSFDKLKKLKKHFESSIIGQPAVINKINEILIGEMYNFSKSSHRPIGILFFVGPTGVGKTETVKELARFLYGTEQIHRFDMSEYKSEVAIQKLIGAPNGYVGYQEGGTLTNAMQKNPNTIVLFDEIEKADKTVFDLFLQLLDEGVVTSNKGVKSYFDNTIVVFTSNIGVSNITARMGYENISNIIKENVEYFFNNTINRPELLGRIGRDNIVVFNLIHEESDLFKILDIQFKPFIKQYENMNIKLKYDKEKLYREIVKNVDLTKGARDLRNKFELFKKHLHSAFFEKEINVNSMKGKTISFSYENGKVKLDIVQNNSKKPQTKKVRKK